MSQVAYKVEWGTKPTTSDELEACMADPMWRLHNLYKIIVKSEDEEGDGYVVQFKPNRAQRRFLSRLWHRNVILKARQLGFTTLIALVWLDFCLFTPNVNCGIIAQDLEAAGAIFKNKVKFAYDNLAPEIRAARPLKTSNASEMTFENGSSIRVATSMRSGTFHRLHVSEFGKICAKFPDKAAEVMTGSIPAVPLDGVLIIESTAEGREGEFYDIVQRASALEDQKAPLTPRDYRMHFYPWHDEPEYSMDPAGVVLTDADRLYFASLEGKIGKRLTDGQKAWYIATRQADFPNKPERMWQEYPSTREEAFQKSTEGCYYLAQMAAVRLSGRLCRLPLLPDVACYTFWDIGNSAGTAIWVVQKVGPEWRCVRFYEAWNESYQHAAKWLRDLGVTYHTHYLPHDADHVRQGQTVNKSPRTMLEELMPGDRFDTVPAIGNVNWGIEQTKNIFPSLLFDLEHTSAGVAHIDSYRAKWLPRQGCWSDDPDKAGGHSEAADALRQLGQAYAAGLINVSVRQRGRDGRANKSKRSWRTA